MLTLIKVQCHELEVNKNIGDRKPSWYVPVFVFDSTSHFSKDNFQVPFAFRVL